MEQLRAFVIVAKTQSISKAAKVVFRSQSAISVQIAKLESQLGKPLFIRSTKALVLTEYGALFLPFATRVFSTLDEAMLCLANNETEVSGKITISTSDTTACYRLPDIIQRFLAKYPSVDIVLRNETSQKSLSLLETNQVDLSIGSIERVSSEFDYIPLWKRELVVICHPGHALAARQRIRLSELECYNTILLDQKSSTRRVIDRACSDHHVVLTIPMQLSSVEVIKSLVQSNVGVSIVSKVSVIGEIEQKRLCSVDVKELNQSQQDIAVVYKKTSYASSALSAFVSFISE